MKKIYTLAQKEKLDYTKGYASVRTLRAGHVNLIIFKIHYMRNIFKNSLIVKVEVENKT